MTDTMRVLLEIGQKRRVVAGAMDWPGLDRWGTSEDNALDKLLSYVPRYAGVAERAGMESAFARSRDVEVVERVPGSSSTDFWGIAHVPSHIEREVLSPADLERRLDLLGSRVGNGGPRPRILRFSGRPAAWSRGARSRREGPTRTRRRCDRAVLEKPPRRRLP